MKLKMFSALKATPECSNFALSRRSASIFKSRLGLFGVGLVFAVTVGCGGGSSSALTASTTDPLESSVSNKGDKEDKKDKKDKNGQDGNVAINDPGCQPIRRTVVHSAGAMRGAGEYVPCVVDTGMLSGEPSLNITSDGTLLRAPTMDPVGIAVSSDNGGSWTLRELPEGSPVDVADSYLDPISGRLFYSAASAGEILFSDDLGVTWQTGLIEHSADEPMSGEGDWPKIFSGAPVTPRADGFVNNIYYCNWTIPLGVNSPSRCYKSTDGGEHFAPVGPVFQTIACENPMVLPGISHGRGVVGPDTGVIYLPVKNCEGRLIYVSHDEGESWTAYPIPNSSAGDSAALALINGVISSGKLSPEQIQYYLENPDARATFFAAFKFMGPEVTTGLTTDGVGRDKDGGLYAVWIDGQLNAKFSYSANGGQTWTESVTVMPPDVIQGALPSIAVTPSGRVGVSFYGTTGDGTWTGYLSISDNGSDESPVFETAAVTPADAPLMDEPCCFGNGLNEYTSARWAPDGSLWAAFIAYRDDAQNQGMLGRLVPIN